MFIRSIGGVADVPGSMQRFDGVLVGQNMEWASSRLLFINVPFRFEDPRLPKTFVFGLAASSKVPRGMVGFIIPVL